MSHTLPSLNYSTDSLEPHIDARTMEIHHGKHHQTYVDKLNAALANEENLSGMKVNDLIKDLTIVPEPIRQAVRNNGGSHSNHTFFWKMLTVLTEEVRPMGVGGCHILDLWLFGCLQGTLCKCGSPASGQALGLVDQAGGWQPCSCLDPQSGFSSHGRNSERDRNTYHWLGHLGTCLLSELSESSSGLRFAFWR